MKRLTIKLPAIKTVKLLDYKYKINIFGGYIEDNRKQNAIWLYHKSIDKLAEYEDTNLTPQEIVEMRADATALFKENKQLRKENEELKNQQIKLAVEKLEELKHYNHPTNTLCLPSCWVIDKVEKMINELKGEKL